MRHTPGEWRTEAVSDAVRVVVGTGRKKIILARLAPKQIPESETHSNALLMAAAPELLEALKELAHVVDLTLHGTQTLNKAHAAIAKAEPQRAHGETGNPSTGPEKSADNKESKK